MVLTPQSSVSYRCTNHIELAIYLTEQGYRTEDPRSAYEYLRLRKGASLIVVYLSGSVILQGGDLETPRALFVALAAPVAETLDLPF